MGGELRQGFGEFENPVFGTLSQDFGDQPIHSGEISDGYGDRAISPHRYSFMIDVKGPAAAERTLMDEETGEIFLDI